MKRRTFLKLAGVGAAGLVAGVSREASANPWGDIATADLGFTPAQKVLEIYLWGGCAPWESFYFRPDPGGKTRGFDAEVAALVWNCPGTPSGLETQFLANDSQSKPIHLGPFAKPLFRSDIRSRMRVVVLSHDLLPHEAAIPYALAGKRLGRPNFNGLGAPLQHRARVLDTGATHPLPYSYCLMPSNSIASPILSAFQSVGAHGGNAKPLALPIGPSSGTFISELDRSAFAPGDNLISQYRAQYRQWLVATGGTSPTRSAAFADYDSSVSSLFSAPQLTTLLTSAPLSPTATTGCSRDPAYPGFPTGYNLGATALQAAAYLLTRTGPQEARYAGIVHGGLTGSPSYDVHDFPAHPNQASITSMNLWDILDGLANVIRDPAHPSPSDSQKLDLNTTLIVIKTEFGRTPYKTGAPASGNGRDHWPDGYVNVLIGGPIQTAGVVGSILDGGGSGDQGKAEMGFSYRPEDINSAVLMAAGIDPFADGNFQLGELTPSLQGANHPESHQRLRQTILGVTP